MTIADVASIALFAMLALLIAVELVRPVRTSEAVRGWRRKCLAFLPLVIAISGAIPFLLAGLIEDIKLLPGDRLGFAGGTLASTLSSSTPAACAQPLPIAPRRVMPCCRSITRSRSSCSAGTASWRSRSCRPARDRGRPHARRARLDRLSHDLVTEY
jgi:hypothetical protein